MSMIGFRIEGATPDRAESLAPAAPMRRCAARPSRRVYFHFATWVARMGRMPEVEAVAQHWTRGNARLAQEWIDDLYRARAARDPDDDLPPCVVGKYGDIAHDIHRSALEIDQ